MMAALLHLGLLSSATITLLLLVDIPLSYLEAAVRKLRATCRIASGDRERPTVVIVGGSFAGLAAGVLVGLFGGFLVGWFAF